MQTTRKIKLSELKKMIKEEVIKEAWDNRTMKKALMKQRRHGGSGIAGLEHHLDTHGVFCPNCGQSLEVLADGENIQCSGCDIYLSWKSFDPIKVEEI